MLNYESFFKYVYEKINDFLILLCVNDTSTQSDNAFFAQKTKNSKKLTTESAHVDMVIISVSFYFLTFLMKNVQMIFKQIILLQIVQRA
jgi:hypothetical protein